MADVRIELLHAEYRGGMVYTPIARPAIATEVVSVRSVAELAAQVEAVRARHAGQVDGQIYISAIGRKCAGFDSFKAKYSRDVQRAS